MFILGFLFFLSFVVTLLYAVCKYVIEKAQWDGYKISMNRQHKRLIMISFVCLGLSLLIMGIGSLSSNQEMDTPIYHEPTSSTDPSSEEQTHIGQDDGGQQIEDEDRESREDNQQDVDKEKKHSHKKKIRLK